MTPKADVSAERKQQIFQAALHCFASQGYHQATMDDIAAESGLSKGALYWYFKSKKELFLSLFQEVLDQLGRQWAQIAASQEMSAADKLRASLAMFRTELKELVPFFGVMMEAWALTRHDEDVESLVRRFYDPYLDIMTQIIEEGVRNNEFDVHFAQATSLVIMTLYDGIVLAMATGIWEHDWEEIIAAAEQMVFRGLRVSLD